MPGGSVANDVVGGSPYDITGMEVTRIPEPGGGHGLQVDIHMNFNPSTDGANTSWNSVGIGALFIGQANAISNPNTPGASATAFVGGYVIQVPTPDLFTAGVGSSGSATLYHITDAGQVQLSYVPSWTMNGIMNWMMNPGDLTGLQTMDENYATPTADPDARFSLADFRPGEAVGYKGPDSGGISGSWAFTAAPSGSNDAGAPYDYILTYKIDGTNLLLDSGEFSLLTSETCANDIIYVASAHLGSVPLPGGFILMGTMLFGAGGVAKWRKRRTQSAA